MCSFRSITTLPYISLYPSKKLLPAIVTSSLVGVNKVMRSFEEFLHSLNAKRMVEPERPRKALRDI